MEEVLLPGTDEVMVMGHKEIDKLVVVRDFLGGRIKLVQAAEVLSLSTRQVSRLTAQVREGGPRGVIHGLRGRPSNHQLDSYNLERVLCALHGPMWHDFGPTFAQQQLLKRVRIRIGVETLRQLMTQVDLWQPGQRKARHRSWRLRRPCVGLLTQLDGSEHDWFEGRGPRCVLIEFIDDATSRVLYAEFVVVEDTHTLLRVTRTYLERWGRPAGLYVDKDSIYKINREATIEEQLEDVQPLTQFSRAMVQLAIAMIFANSPQAKGRVERAHGTHQDRLVKELRLRGISDIASANGYLWGKYLPEHNARFAVTAAEPRDAHRPLLACHNLDAIMAIQIERQVQNDFVVQHDKRFYQLLPEQPVRVNPKDRVVVVEHLDGSVQVVFKKRVLNVEILPQRPYRPYYHPRIRSRGKPQPDPFYGVPQAQPSSPRADAFKMLEFDPVLALRRQAEHDAHLRGRDGC